MRALIHLNFMRHCITDNGRTVHAGTIQNDREVFDQIIAVTKIQYQPVPLIFLDHIIHVIFHIWECTHWQTNSFLFVNMTKCTNIYWLNKTSKWKLGIKPITLRHYSVFTTHNKCNNTTMYVTNKPLISMFSWH